MTLGEIRRHLAELDLQPSRKLGQNFLHDQNLAAWMLTKLEPGADQHLVEIGPGLGALTETLATHPGGLTLIERDLRLAEFLKKRFGDRVELFSADAARFDFRMFFPRQPAKLIGNLPYSAASAILLRAATAPSPFDGMLITVQKEMADRLTAGPGSADYGSLTLQLAFGWKTSLLRKLPGSVFHPAPKVESAVVKLERRTSAELPDCDPATFARLVRLGFSQRRKQLRNLLKLPDWPAQADRIGVPETVRAEDLDLNQWSQLVRGVQPAETETVGAELQIVDDRDRPIGSAPRGEVHRRNLLHQAVHIFIFNRHGELFLQKRSRWKDRHAGQWDSSAAGHVDAGETYEATAPRELREELGVETGLERHAFIEACPETGWEFVQLYVGRHDGPFQLAHREIETGAFFPPSVIEEWVRRRPGDFAPGFLKCWALVVR